MSIDADRLWQKYSDLKDRFRVVTDVALRLTSELDQDALLGLIVREARRLTASDAGSLYVRDGAELAFVLAQNDSLPEAGRSVKAFRFPIDSHTLVGLAASSKRTLNIPDVQNHASYDRATAARLGYEVHTMLVVPMLDHRKELLGVLQLMNPLDADGKVHAYDDDTAYLAEVLASHAATAVEVARLYARITELLDAMVRYTARAIDARDPSTAGHSGRVANYAHRLAEYIGGFSKAELKELRYAGLFHDVGKIGVPEAILTKRNKLSDAVLSQLEERFEAARRAHEVAVLRAAPDRDAPAVDAAIRVRTAELDDHWQFIVRANEPRPLPDDAVERLQRIGTITFVDSKRVRRALLEPLELEALCVRRGNLTPAEREIMNSHVSMSHSMIKKFPFTPELARIPDLVHMHHEKWDGTGYPLGLKGEAIPLGARILAVVDAFDALTAQDRPYKKPIPVDRSLDILTSEAAAGQWDPRVVGLLREAVETAYLKMRKFADSEF